MIAIALGLVMMGQAETPAALVSKMLARYSSAQTLVGTIVFVQSAAGASVTTTTHVQYEKPSKLYVRQVRASSDPAESSITCDGARFSYDVPKDVAATPGQRLIETVEQGGVRLDVKEIYAASGRSLIDRSAPLDIAISRLEDLKFLRNQWATVESLGKTEQDGEVRQMVGGQWREYGTAAVSGRYTMWIGPQGDLRQYEVRERLAVRDQAATEVVSSWQVKLTVNGKPDPALFTLKR